ncbi:MucBP domain-containing protein [Listeria welshimeri]|nr:MucBP domain-containing protein [Listeria welshimeri]
MNKKLGLLLFAVSLTFGGFLLGNSPVYAAEGDTSSITYQYVDFDTLTNEQKNSIIKGNPTETLDNDYENYSFVYQKNTSGDSANTDNNSAGGSNGNGNSVDGNSTSGNASSGNSLIKTGDVGPDIYLIMLGFVLVGGGIGLLTLKKRHAKQLLLFLIIFGGGSIMIGSIAQAVENSNLKPQETTTVTKGTKETKKPGSIEGYTYVGYIHTSKNDTTPTPPVEQGTVTVNYQDEQGNSVAPSETLKGDIGKTYKTVQKDIEGYDFKEVQGNATGEFTTKAQVVTYIYTKTPVPAANLTIEYLDENGNQIHEPKIISGNVGDPYDVTGDMDELQIEGYTIDTTKLPANATGVLSNEPIQVIYVYNKNPLADVKITVKFVDAQGNPFTVIDFTTFKNGDFVPHYPNLDQYKLKLDFNKQVYSQNQVVPDIVLQGKEGDAYNLPERMNFNIIDDKGNSVPYLISQNEDDSSSGIINFYNITSTPENREGTLTDQDIVVTYKIEEYDVYMPAP